MHARDLMVWLHERLAQQEEIEKTLQRFERLRGNALLPRGRENAGLRLSDEQIANAVLAFAHPLPGFAGHASLILGDLRPVGGNRASFRGTLNLQEALASLIGNEDASSNVLRLTLSVEHDFQGDEYGATLRLSEDGQVKTISFVSKYAYTLLQDGAEIDYNHERLERLTSIDRSFSAEFFRDLAQEVSISRHLDLPLKTDWREYEAEEEKAEFHKRLGARLSSRFLNLRVDTQVTWPKEPTRIEFGGHHFVIFPMTGDNSHSISIDLAHEHLSLNDARSLANRLLSLMSWCDDRPASLDGGWAGNPVPVPVPKEKLAFSTVHHWYFSRALPDDERLKKCLAFYRDGLNAYSVGLASHAVLSFYRVFETKVGQKRRTAIKWIDSTVEAIVPSFIEDAKSYEEDRNSFSLGHGEYIYIWCRVATAHAAHDAPSDPDGAEETQRLLNAARIIQKLARYHIKQEFGFSDSYLTDALR